MKVIISIRITRAERRSCVSSDMEGGDWTRFDADERSMNLAVRIRSRRVGSRASDSLRAHIQRRLQVSLAPFDQRLSHVSVRVTDTESVAGEPLYACHVEVEIRPSGGFLAEEAADPDVSTAVDLAADRIGLALRRTLASTAGGLAALETG